MLTLSKRQPPTHPCVDLGMYASLPNTPYPLPSGSTCPVVPLFFSKRTPWSRRPELRTHRQSCATECHPQAVSAELADITGSRTWFLPEQEVTSSEPVPRVKPSQSQNHCRSSSSSTRTPNSPSYTFSMTFSSSATCLVFWVFV